MGPKIPSIPERLSLEGEVDKKWALFTPRVFALMALKKKIDAGQPIRGGGGMDKGKVLSYVGNLKNFLEAAETISNEKSKGGDKRTLLGHLSSFLDETREYNDDALRIVSPDDYEELIEESKRKPDGGKAVA